MKEIAAAALLAGAVFGVSAAEKDPRWYLTVDNDVVFHTDRWYTSGVNISRVAPAGDHEMEWSLIQEIYTPEGKRFEPGTVDRAPIGRLLLSGARHDMDALRFQTIQVALGVRGRAALGRRTTEVVHHVVPSPFVDWDREDATHFDALVAGVRSHSYGPVVIHYGGVAGNSRTFAHAGAQVGFGPTLHSPLLRYAPTPPPAAGTGGWSGFAGVGGRAVILDKLVERSYDAALAPPSRERFVGRFAAGVGSVYSWGSVSFAIAMDTPEFEGQRIGHRFGSLMLHVDF